MSIEYFLNIAPALFDAVVSDAILGEIVSADLLGAVGETDLFAPFFSYGADFLSLFNIQ